MEELEKIPEAARETVERTTTPPLAPRPSNESRPRKQHDLSSLAELAKVIEFNMSQQAKRIAELADSHDKRTSVLDQMAARIEATTDILEDHAASLEETIERQETMVAALIKLVQTMTRQGSQASQTHENTPTPQTTTSETK